MIFSVQRPAVVKHINNIYKSSELDFAATCYKMEQVAADGKKRKIHLYKPGCHHICWSPVNSTQANQFRQWATKYLKDYLIQGYSINEKWLMSDSSSESIPLI
ncbi:RhuM family protein [Dyadobacter sp. CY326]|uniref:RhuM family protein n=1 Tax=Dyadobacter sp. CY326 TaxID=2907300 RepID=UPI0038D48B4E